MSNNSDNFNRASAGSLGSPWVDVVGAWDTVNGAQASATSSVAHAASCIDSGTSNTTVQVTCFNISSVARGIVLRSDGTNQNYLALRERTGSAPKLELVKRVGGGTVTQIGSADPTVAAGDILKAVMNGSTIDCYHNGSLLFSVTETAGQSNTKHGVYAPSNTSAQLDDYSNTDLVGGGPFPFHLDVGSMSSFADMGN